MNKKTIRILRKLIDQMPEELREPWRFDASNVGGGYWQHYGIVSDATLHIFPGIDVRTGNSWRQHKYSDSPKVDENKLANIVAAYVATLHPTNVQALLDEIDEYRGLLQELRDEFEALAAIATVQPITTHASAFEKLVAEIEETLEKFGDGTLYNSKSHNGRNR